MMNFQIALNEIPEVVIWHLPLMHGDRQIHKLWNWNEVCVRMPTAYFISPFILVTPLFSRLGKRLAW